MKIDTSKIEGYAEMTPEQKLAALEGFEYEDHAAELEKQKAAVSKANSDAGQLVLQAVSDGRYSAGAAETGG